MASDKLWCKLDEMEMNVLLVWAGDAKKTRAKPKLKETNDKRWVLCIAKYGSNLFPVIHDINDSTT